LTSALAAILIGLSLGAVPARAMHSQAGADSNTIRLAQGCQMLGPYATMRRANEVANVARVVGYSALPFHNGDGYYVRVC
jgi:hypothetical protein